MQTQLSVDLTPNHRVLLESTIPDVLDHAARTWPDKTALHFVESGERLTWSQVRDAVARLRSALVALGLQPGEKVGIMLCNQLEFPLAWLAIIEAGAVAVPVNPKYTRREVEFVLGDAEASWLIVAADLAELTSGTVPPDHVIVTGPSFAELLDHPETARTYQAGRDDLVGIQFTSGTTGLPKGCLHSHAYWLELGAYGAALFDDPQHILADHPFHYMQNLSYLMLAFAGGGQLHVTPGLSRRKFLRWLIDHEIDHAWIDEGMLDFPPSELDSQLPLRKAPVAAVPPALHRPLEERFHLMARDLYGSNEVGIGTFVPWERPDLMGDGSMGWCVPNRESKVVDSDGHELPPGQAGELCFRGRGLMLGYHNRPEANAELFLPGGWFRTGDLVRKTEDGRHYFIGRTRDMVRRSGESISCAEVEMHILAHPEVADAAVIPVPDPDRDEEVKAIVVRKPGAALTVAALIAWCREGLASFKVPRYVEFREELPLTSSGKIAKAALKAEAPFTAGVVDVLAPAADLV
ncbi:acyl-CoA synthetase (AMP-forming)/AMP-acid ligase II [Kibdelosporangium banguiense]|uniref:Acyl-CoA synthetase (AMP-forming)/AMP-acid ligase II n=1 Tax=Kibdelosporangium banguiense TaxID=1365924 RepID=A0ABS4TPY0_9PSEU|nr:class I adenylate-forming enzyme family protein [Kibdelosporangium banguiense]MBP2326460.1 acyl-CoA synthetase (AMP-forming)/AMP-acid ligase II [Kibdelosporangium banguiense]